VPIQFFTTPMNRESIKLLLIQIRLDHMEQHEYQCFVETSGLKPSQIIAHNIFHQAVDFFKLKTYDGVIIGGSGEFNLFDEKVAEPNQKLMDVVHRCYQDRVPFLGACYGHQLAALALGGEVSDTEDYRETGSIEIMKTQEAEHDLLFQNLPPKFYAQAGHKDTVVTLPPAGILLAKSERCPIHAFKISGTKMYAVQFHPELDKEGLYHRISYYQGYAKNKEHLEKILATAKDSPEAARLTQYFIDGVILGN
jgi:GMP synthase (glutamine-hydrolysing)